ncbi:hypothetical protein [Colwellia sp. 12G3]|uniref:hypothetical protein n=1 Tax=Colwellia sp. 12G3 TaxID=2058299 RepID=UPI001E33CDB2|nr:hypothetical protein [Colwellia sp. 12G3]
MKMKSRTKLACYAVVSSLLISQSVLAKETELADKLQICGEISLDTARLSCFDQLIKKQSATIVEAETTEFSAAQVDDFSKDHIKKTAEEKTNELLSISLTISKLEMTTRGQWIITFNNGQKWQQKDATKLRLKQGDQVTLTKGALSSVFLQKENTNKRIKVKRLK